jgi:uncharacterized protein YgiM (DUF1202 family)
MRKLFFISLTILAAVLVFSVITFLFIQNKSKGALQVTSNPNSKVYLDGKYLGNTPFQTKDSKDMLPEGEYTIKLIPLFGKFSQYEQKFTISPKALTVIDKTFAEKGFDDASIINLSQITDKQNAQVSVITFPQGSQILLDNSLRGKSPILLNNITGVDHELKITKDGYIDKIVRIRPVLGFKLEALIYLGINPNVAASPSAVPGLSNPTTSGIAKILILDTPTGFLRVRDQASLAGIEMGQVKPGETYQLLSEQNGWYQIKFNNKEGWINSQYAKKQ